MFSQLFPQKIQYFFSNIIRIFPPVTYSLSLPYKILHSMENDTKEKIQYSTAVAMVISAVVLAFICFFLNHYKIEDSVLWYIAQALVYAASIFGISLAIKTKMGEVKNDVKQYVDDELNKHKDAKH